MSKQAVLNRKGQTLGYIETTHDGWQSAINALGKVLAIFDPRTNETKDSTGRTLSEGNLLSGMIRGHR